jgi:hypothetical protein
VLDIVFLPSFRPTQGRRGGAIPVAQLIPDDLESSLLAKLFAITWCNICVGQLAPTTASTIHSLRRNRNA